jgi:hypothetical protein
MVYSLIAFSIVVCFVIIGSVRKSKEKSAVRLRAQELAQQNKKSQKNMER